MGILAKARGYVAALGRRLAKYGEYQLPNGWLYVDSVAGGAAGQTIPAIPRSLLAEYQTGPWVYSCIAAIAKDCAGMPWHLKRVVKGGADEVVTDHEVLKVLDRPLPKKTWVDLVEAHVTYLELAGKAFIEKVRRSDDTVPVGLAVMRPDVTKVIIDREEGVTGFEYSPNGYRLGEVQSFDPDDVVYQTHFNPLNPDDGLPTVLPAWLTVQMDRAATQWNWDFFRNGASPDVIMSTDKPVPPDMMTRITTDFEQKNSTARGRGRRAHLVPFGVKVDTTSPSHREMQFEKLIGQGIATMCAIFGVPPVRLGRETMSYATADKQLQMYLKYRLVPLMESVLRMLTIEVVEEWPDGEELYLELDYDAIMSQEEKAAKTTGLVALFQAGVLSRPEVRSELGYAPTEDDEPEERGAAGRDVERTTVEAREGEEVAEKPEEQPPTQAAEGEPAAKRDETARPRTPYRLAKARDKRTPAVEAKLREAFDARLAKQKARVAALVARKLGLTKGANGDARQPASCGTNGKAHADDEDGGASVRAGLAHLSRLILARDPVEAVALAKDDDAPKPAKKVELSDREIHDALDVPVSDAIKKALAEGVEIGGETQGEAFGIQFRIHDEDVQEFLSERAGDLIVEVDDSTVEMVRETLRSAYDHDLSDVKTAEKLAESGAFAPSRAQRIARTEAHRAVQSGAFEGMKQAGVEEVEWLTAMDDAVRDIHQSMNGQVRKVGEPFEDGDGNELMFPGDPNAPPESSVNCRCVLLTRESEASSDDLAEALDLLPSGDEDDGVEEKLTDAMMDLPREVVSRIDPDDVRSLRYAVGRGRDASYDVETRTATVGPKARAKDVQVVVEQHLASSIMSASDARGFRNQLVTANLVDAKGWDAMAGTEREKAVRAVTSIIARDRGAVEGALGGKLTDDEWRRAQIVAGHFWVVGRTGGKVPKKTNPK